MRKTVDKTVQFDDPNAYIAGQIQKYQQRNRVLQDIVAKGDRIRATATGQEMVDNRTCTCGSYGTRKKDHAEECAVEIVTDPTPVIAAIKEMRLNDTYLDGLRSQVTAPPESAEIAAAFEWVEQLVADLATARADLADAHTQLAAYESGRITDAELVPAANVVNGDGPHPPAAYK